MAVAFQKDFETVQCLAEQMIFKGDSTEGSRRASSSASSSSMTSSSLRSTTPTLTKDDAAATASDDSGVVDAHSTTGEHSSASTSGQASSSPLTKKLKSPFECGFKLTQTKPAVFFKVLTDEDIRQREKARHEKRRRAAEEIAEIEARRCADEKRRHRRRQLEYRERRVREAIMRELRELRRHGHPLEHPDQVHPSLRGDVRVSEGGAGDSCWAAEENALRKRLFHGCFREFTSVGRLYLRSRAARRILDTVTWTPEELQLYYECMARHNIPVHAANPALLGAGINNQGACNPHLYMNPVTGPGIRTELMTKTTKAHRGHQVNGGAPYLDPRSPPSSMVDVSAGNQHESSGQQGKAGGLTEDGLRIQTSATDGIVTGDHQAGTRRMEEVSKANQQRRPPLFNGHTCDVEFVDELLKDSVEVDAAPSAAGEPADVDLYDDL